MSSRSSHLLFVPTQQHVTVYEQKLNTIITSVISRPILYDEFSMIEVIFSQRIVNLTI